MVFPVLPNGRLDQVLLQLPCLTKNLGFILDFLRELREFETGKKAMHGSQ